MDSASSECVAATTDRLSSVILDCVHALEHLYQALLHECIDPGWTAAECFTAVKNGITLPFALRLAGCGLDAVGYFSSSACKANSDAAFEACEQSYPQGGPQNPA